MKETPRINLGANYGSEVRLIMVFRLDTVIPWGRSFDEYVRIFGLSENDGREILRR